MGKTKILTLAVLGTALADLITQSAGSPLEKALQAFQSDFTSYCDSPQEADQTKITELTKANEGKDADIKKHLAALDQSKTVITDLKAKLKAAEARSVSKTDKPVVDIDGEKYVINHGAHPHSVKDLAANPELCKEILEIEGQNAISKF